MASGISGSERSFRDNEIIVSKTDLQGRMTYCNDVFIRISGYAEAELIGKPHNMIRHPAMPRCVFKLLWDTISQGRELFAYVVNRCKNGDYYWVYAHVTVDLDDNGDMVGYHSNRRSPDRKAINVIEPLYARLLEEEGRHTDRKAGIDAATNLLLSILAEKGVSYEQFVFSL
ncbi:putative Chemotaxis sensory transducer [Magnetospirillum gryphiswaldense MSR-1 v2]|uniref:Chemotaxis sensory transducer n=1 Tax=Magnetospirillum gryphiswaldense (strain DSM 6361 / JCM 21280 / NBRC 15271 / MSR-1) TaxID=431944 RepID=V6F6N2_MAGGM|nr:PAS domain-containing protein [Magnetospirillum gryphiswaldense]CDL00148.1 putative Chemotaxis sensory transducer [Magnetospirillum gryphiswaldense MSR-1 v2]